MSYILEALRRADAERSRGAVPGLHAQRLPADAEPAARDYRPLLWAAGGAGALLVAGVVVLLLAPWKSVQVPTESHAALAPTPELAPAPRDAAAASAPARMAQGELPAPQPGAIEPGARAVEPPMRRDSLAPAAPVDVPAPRAYPPPAARTAPRDTVAARTAAPVQAPPPAPGGHDRAPAAPPTTAARGDAVPDIKDLPPDVRARLPRLAVAGSVYSETPSARMVILNGQVFHEGEKPAPDTVLEQIRLKSVVLDFRGQRYEISF